MSKLTTPWVARGGDRGGESFPQPRGLVGLALDSEAHDDHAAFRARQRRGRLAQLICRRRTSETRPKRPVDTCIRADGVISSSIIDVGSCQSGGARRGVHSRLRRVPPCLIAAGKGGFNHGALPGFVAIGAERVSAVRRWVC